MKWRRPLLTIVVLLALIGSTAAPLLWATMGGSVRDLGAAAGSDRAAVAEARVKPALERDLDTLGLHYGAPVFMRIFKREKTLELWVQGDDLRFVLFRSYPVCAWSGELGPKQKQGDNQAPEGFYPVAASQLNPHSRYHLAFNLGYPNAYDRAHARTGDFLMVHGNCVSIGCYAMGDDAIEEIYSLAAAALRNGQDAFAVHAFPFRLDAAELEAEQHSPWHAFWSELKPAYDVFELTRRPPRIRVRDRRYTLTES